MIELCDYSIEELRDDGELTVSRGRRAGDPTFESVDLNEATREVIALSRGELQRNPVTLLPELADGLSTIAGDRVQLQRSS
jgi:hypothetical protein